MTLASNQPSPNRRKGRVLCGAKTRAGGCCQVRAEPGNARCRFHGGKSTGPKTQAGRARIAEAQRLRWPTIERGIGRSEVTTKPDLKGKHASLRRNAITSDVVTRLWRRLSEAALAHQPKRIGNEGRCRSNNGSIRPTTQTEGRPSWRRTPPARECPSVAVRAAVRS